MRFEGDAWWHLIDVRSGKLRTRQIFKREVLHGNLGFIFAMMTWTIRESAFCLVAAQGFIEEGVARQMDDLKDEGFQLFHPLDNRGSST